MANLAIGQNKLVQATREHDAVLTILNKIGSMPELPVRAEMARQNAPCGITARDAMVHKERVFFGLTAEELLLFDSRRAMAEVGLTSARWKFREAAALARSFSNNNALTHGAGVGDAKAATAQ